ncbi:MAG: glutathione S-transferase family protein [bacterium]
MQLYENPGWGSAIVEAQLAILGLKCEMIAAGDIYADVTAREALAQSNPIIQIPTLILDDGQVMTESAAITLYLADLTGSTVLVPEAGSPERAAFLRWLVFIVANIYPCFTFADVPTRFVAEAEAQAYKDRVTDHATRLWKVVAAEAERNDGTWVLGNRFTALDVYLAVMVNWRPGRATLANETPVLAAIAARAAARPDMAAVIARNFP